MRRVQRALVVAAGLWGALAHASAWAQADAERLKTAKSLYFDRKFVEARELWLQIKQAGGADAEQAAFWVARCSDSLAERERALKEYSEYLAARPSDPTLAEEARTNRVRLATQLYEAGRKQHLPVISEALHDASKTVRYFAAFQLASLGPEVGQPAVAVLKKILAEERDEDLVERAKLRLLKVDPKALAVNPRPAPRAQVRVAPAPSPARIATMIRLRIFDRGKAEPTVSINLPVALADLVFKSLPDEAKRELRLKGYDAENFWERLKSLGPTDIIEIVGDDGERIKIWIE